MVEDLSIDEWVAIGQLALFHADPVSRERMIEVAKGRIPEENAFKRLLYLDGPNHGWLQTGRHADATLHCFASGGAPAVDQRIHASPRYYLELMQFGFTPERFKELGFRMEPTVYQLESLGDPFIARFLGWYSELHDEHGNHIEPKAS